MTSKFLQTMLGVVQRSHYGRIHLGSHIVIAIDEVIVYDYEVVFMKICYIHSAQLIEFGEIYLTLFYTGNSLTTPRNNL